jgi:T5SS/PEP-CTERM-associated repeat protein
MSFTDPAPSWRASVNSRRVLSLRSQRRPLQCAEPNACRPWALNHRRALGAALLLVCSLLLGSGPAYGTEWKKMTGYWDDLDVWSAGIPTAAVDAFIDVGTATLVDPGARARDFFLGYLGQGYGALEVLGGEAQFSRTVVGGNGYGELKITSGGQVVSTEAQIAYEAGSSGSVLIHGPGSRWTVSSTVTMGLLNRGVGTLDIRGGGVLSAATGMTMGFNGTVRGDGTIAANFINDGGLIAPEAASGTAPGTLHITGNFTQQRPQSARLQIEVASAASFDKLAVTGNMALSGQLDITLTGGYVPNGSQSFNILDWGGSLSSQFDFIILRPLGGMVTLDTSQLYTTGVVTLTGPTTSFTADFDEDGDVDGGDLVQWRGDFGINALSDADNDGDSDGADFLAWQRQLGSSPMLSATATAVPESRSAGLLLMASVGCALAGRRSPWIHWAQWAGSRSRRPHRPRSKSAVPNLAEPPAA